jgi:hypothetical protein
MGSEALVFLTCGETSSTAYGRMKSCRTGRSQKKTQSDSADMMPSSRALLEEHAMDDAAFWREQALTFRGRAEAADDVSLYRELLDLAEICEQVATEIEDRATAG